MTLFPRSFEEWYKKFVKEEKNWIVISFIVAIILALTTLNWHFASSHQVPDKFISVSPEEFKKLAESFAQKYEGKVIPEDVEIYLEAKQFSWVPSKIILKKGITYKIWISSTDVMHGFSLIGNGVVYNLMVMPGMAYLLNIKFDKTGIYEIRCNEYCGEFHGLMIGYIEVVE